MFTNGTQMKMKMNIHYALTAFLLLSVFTYVIPGESEEFRKSKVGSTTEGVEYSPKQLKNLLGKTSSAYNKNSKKLAKSRIKVGKYREDLNILEKQLRQVTSEIESNTKVATSSKDEKQKRLALKLAKKSEKKAQSYIKKIAPLRKKLDKAKKELAGLEAQQKTLNERLGVLKGKQKMVLRDFEPTRTIPKAKQTSSDKVSKLEYRLQNAFARIDTATAKVATSKDPKQRKIAESELKKAEEEAEKISKDLSVVKEKLPKTLEKRDSKIATAEKEAESFKKQTKDQKIAKKLALKKAKQEKRQAKKAEKEKLRQQKRARQKAEKERKAAKKKQKEVRRLAKKSEKLSGKKAMIDESKKAQKKNLKKIDNFQSERESLKQPLEKKSIASKKSDSPKIGSPLTKTERVKAKENEKKQKLAIKQAANERKAAEKAAKLKAKKEQRKAKKVAKEKTRKQKLAIKQAANERKAAEKAAKLKAKKAAKEKAKKQKLAQKEQRASKKVSRIKTRDELRKTEKNLKQTAKSQKPSKVSAQKIEEKKGGEGIQTASRDAVRPDAKPDSSAKKSRVSSEKKMIEKQKQAKEPSQKTLAKAALKKAKVEQRAAKKAAKEKKRKEKIAKAKLEKEQKDAKKELKAKRIAAKKAAKEKERQAKAVAKKSQTSEKPPTSKGEQKISSKKISKKTSVIPSKDDSLKNVPETSSNTSNKMDKQAAKKALKERKQAERIARKRQKRERKEAEKVAKQKRREQKLAKKRAQKEKKLAEKRASKEVAEKSKKMAQAPKIASKDTARVPSTEIPSKKDIRKAEKRARVKQRQEADSIVSKLPPKSSGLETTKKQASRTIQEKSKTSLNEKRKIAKEKARQEKLEKRRALKEKKVAEKMKRRKAKQKAVAAKKLAKQQQRQKKLAKVSQKNEKIPTPTASGPSKPIPGEVKPKSSQQARVPVTEPSRESVRSSKVLGEDKKSELKEKKQKTDRSITRKEKRAAKRLAKEKARQKKIAEKRARRDRKAAEKAEKRKEKKKKLLAKKTKADQKKQERDKSRASIKDLKRVEKSNKKALRKKERDLKKQNTVTRKSVQKESPEIPKKLEETKQGTEFLSLEEELNSLELDLFNLSPDEITSKTPQKISTVPGGSTSKKIIPTIPQKEALQKSQKELRKVAKLKPSSLSSGKEKRMVNVEKNKGIAKKKLEKTEAEFSAAESTLNKADQELNSLIDSIRTLEKEEQKLKDEYASRSQQVLDFGGSSSGEEALKEAQKLEKKIISKNKKLKEKRGRKSFLKEKVTKAEEEYQSAQASLYKAKKEYKRATRGLSSEGESSQIGSQVAKLTSPKSRKIREQTPDTSLERIPDTPSKSQFQKEGRSIIPTAKLDSERRKLEAELSEFMDFGDEKEDIEKDPKSISQSKSLGRKAKLSEKQKEFKGDELPQPKKELSKKELSTLDELKYKRAQAELEQAKSVVTKYQDQIDELNRLAKKNEKTMAKNQKKLNRLKEGKQKESLLSQYKANQKKSDNYNRLLSNYQEKLDNAKGDVEEFEGRVQEFNTGYALTPKKDKQVSKATITEKLLNEMGDTTEASPDIGDTDLLDLELELELAARAKNLKQNTARNAGVRTKNEFTSAVPIAKKATIQPKVQMDQIDPNIESKFKVAEKEFNAAENNLVKAENRLKTIRKKISDLEKEEFKMKEVYAKISEEVLNSREEGASSQVLSKAKDSEKRIIKISKELKKYREEEPQAVKALEIANKRFQGEEGKFYMAKKEYKKFQRKVPSTKVKTAPRALAKELPRQKSQPDNKDRKQLELELEAMLFGTPDRGVLETELDDVLGFPEKGEIGAYSVGEISKDKTEFVDVLVGIIGKSSLTDQSKFQNSVKKVTKVLNKRFSDLNTAADQEVSINKRVSNLENDLSRLRTQIRTNLKLAIGAKNLAERNLAVQQAHRIQDLAISSAKELAYLYDKREVLSQYAKKNKKTSSLASQAKPRIDIFRFGSKPEDQLRVLKIELQNSRISEVEKVIDEIVPDRTYRKNLLKKAKKIWLNTPREGTSKANKIPTKKSNSSLGFYDGNSMPEFRPLKSSGENSHIFAASMTPSLDESSNELKLQISHAENQLASSQKKLEDSKKKIEQLRREIHDLELRELKVNEKYSLETQETLAELAYGKPSTKPLELSKTETELIDIREKLLSNRNQEPILHDELQRFENEVAESQSHLYGLKKKYRKLSDSSSDMIGHPQIAEIDQKKKQSQPYLESREQEQLKYKLLEIMDDVDTLALSEVKKKVFLICWAKKQQVFSLPA